jgi:hypothetical protein
MATVVSWAKQGGRRYPQIGTVGGNVIVWPTIGQAAAPAATSQGMIIMLSWRRRWVVA